MKAIKRKISLFLAGLMVASAVSVMPTKAEGTTAMPTNVTFTNAHREVIAGDEMGVFVTSEAEGQVQYKVWFYDAEGTWTSTDYSEAVDSSVPYYMELPSTFKEGQNTISVWVKRADVDVTETEHYKEDVKSGYDSFNYSHLYADKTGFSAGEKINYTMNGKTVTINGVDGVEEGSEFKVYFYDYANSKWGTISTEWSGEPVEYTFEEEGYYLIDVQINKAGSDDKYDALRMEVVQIKEAAASTVNVTTEFVQGTMFNDVKVSADNDAIASYKLFANFNGTMKALHGDAVALGETAKGLFVSNGEEVTVKFFDAEGMEVAETTVKVGENTSFELEEKEVKEYAITTEFVQGTMFNDVAVTCEDTEVASFQVYANFNGEMKALHGEPVANGETAKGLFVSKGEEVTVKLFDAEGNVLGQVKAEL